MIALLNQLRRGANDASAFAQAPQPRRTSLVILPERREQLFWLLAAGMICCLLIVSGGVYWMMRHIDATLDKTAAPELAVLTTAPAVPVTVSSVPSPAAAPKTITKPATDPADPANAIVMPAGILLPAPAADPTAPDAATVAFMAKKIGRAAVTVSAKTDQPAEDDSQIITLDDASSQGATSAAEDEGAETAANNPATIASDLMPAIHFENDADEETELAAAPIVAAPAGKSHKKQDLQAQAIARLDQAVRQTPDNLVDRFSLAVAYDRAGQKAAALGVYRQVLSLYADLDSATRPALPIAAIRARMIWLSQIVMPRDAD